MTNTVSTPCFVYKDARKPGIYIYLTARDDFSRIPEALQKQFGKLEFVLEFTLHAERSLAKEDPAQVLHNLQTQGFHLQLPDKDELDIATH